ncbi:hypothetical protein EO087_13960 [Dyella sp. M7H15-1]|uniref:hypothetical protein n=1 Tax=Dyella sp. M7H15-1 TaxID=2501295 RepID=UPI0010051645|nr:hypothetical protein [Dyella sp. M7H15-1]QAU24961.1 hypothetical protein EO087_13960 [Dyella sp. M7H15-1]
MSNSLIAYVLSLIIGINAVAEDLPIDSQHITGSDEGTITCKTEQAMVTLMKASTALTTNEKVLSRLVESGDCLIMPRGWLVLRAKDPPLDQQEDHASQWTIRTPNGIVHMWGTPFGGD